jgi:secreted trypsin-like serine protease
MPAPLRRVTAALVGIMLGALAGLTAVDPAQAIHRGHDAPFGSYRFMVSLRLANTPDSPRCGGTLIAADMVLTAAHCVIGVPQGGLVAVVGADIPDWPDAPQVSTLGHLVPETFDISVDNRDDVAVVRLAVPQPTPTVRLADAEPRVGDRVLTLGWGCTNAPPVCEVAATTLQASRQRVLTDASCGPDVFWTRPLYYAPTTVCTKGVRPRSTINRGDSGGPLLVREHGRFRQVGITSLGSDSTVKLYAGFTSIPVEADWIADAVESLRSAGAPRPA